MIFSLIGLSMFFYIPGGWFNNRFSIRSLLITGMAIRFITMCIVIFLHPSFMFLKIIAVIWGLVEAFFWPAVLNGVVFYTDREHRGLGFGLLESIRRGQEVIMNLILVAIMAAVGSIAVLKGGMLVYNLLLIPLIILIWKYVPKNGIAADENHDAETGYKSAKALKGLLYVLIQPKVWLAAITAMSVYWSYIILIYTVPYLQSVYHFDLHSSLFTKCISFNNSANSFLRCNQYRFNRSISRGNCRYYLRFCLQIVSKNDWCGFDCICCNSCYCCILSSWNYIQHCIVSYTFPYYISIKKCLARSDFRIENTRRLFRRSDECWFIFSICSCVLGVSIKWKFIRFI
ncbi:MFS transporter [Staphylococcus carnosus]|nr:MFS transporter [Staphylococcus carnosus]